MVLPDTCRKRRLDKDRGHRPRKLSQVGTSGRTTEPFPHGSRPPPAHLHADELLVGLRDLRAFGVRIGVEQRLHAQHGEVHQRHRRDEFEVVHDRQILGPLRPRSLVLEPTDHLDGIRAVIRDVESDRPPVVGCVHPRQPS